MVKFKLYFDKNKETAWLNEMANQGYAMKSFFAGFYTFEECEKGEYTYQIDIQDKLFKVTDDYRDFMNETGVEIVQIWGFWVILRKKASEGAFELYTDVDSQLEHYKKILILFKAVTIIELICLMIECISAASSNSPIVWGFACLILTFVFVFLRMIFRTKGIICMLTEKKTGIPEKENKNISPLLLVGLLFNSIALMSRESLSEPLSMTLSIIAIIFMLTGLVHTATFIRKDN